MKKYFLLFLFVLVGCETTAEFERSVKQIEEKMYSDLFSSYYTSEKNLPDVNTRLSGEEAAYYRIENLKQDSNKLLNDGYVLLGKLAFTDNLAERYVGEICKRKTTAYVCLYSREFFDSSVGSIYGNVYTINSYKFNIYFFGKMTAEEWQKRLSWGFLPADLTDSQRQEYQRNTGIIADIVYKNSKAYYANLLQGDLIIRINGKPVHDANSAKEYLSYYDGDSYVITVLRNGKRVNIRY